MEEFEFSIGQDTKLPELIVEASGVSTLEGATELLFHWWPTKTGGVVKTGTASLVGDGSAKQLKYSWPNSGDTSVSGPHEGYFSGKASDGKPFMAPNHRRLRFNIQPKKT